MFTNMSGIYTWISLKQTGGAVSPPLALLHDEQSFSTHLQAHRSDTLAMGDPQTQRPNLT